MASEPKTMAPSSKRTAPKASRKQASVTGNEEAKSPEAIRQERYRQKLEELGVKVVEVQLGPVERELLEAARKARGGLDGPYSVGEYVATLLRRDFELLEQQQGKIAGRICENCLKPLPRGCGGTWASEAACLRSQTDRAMQL